MPTYSKNLYYLREAVFAKLNSDTTLKALLGGTRRIFHKNPPKDAIYPCVVYDILSDRDRPFEEDQDTGEMTETYIRIHIYSKKDQPEEIDNIEARIKQLLHGQRTLDTTKIICYSCFRDNLVTPMKDPETFVWVTPTRYRIRWAVK